MNGDSKGSGVTRSWGEFQIKEILDKTKMKYIQEYSFDNLKSIKNKKLRFDFAIFDKDDKMLCLIEYDGRQHFEYKENWKISKEDWISLRENDKIKNEYCKDNNIPLYRINYLDDIQNRMNEIFLQLQVK